MKRKRVCGTYFCDVHRPLGVEGYTLLRDRLRSFGGNLAMMLSDQGIGGEMGRAMGEKCFVFFIGALYHRWIWWKVVYETWLRWMRWMFLSRLGNWSS